MEHALLVKDLIKIYNTNSSSKPKAALNKVSLSIKKGTIFGLLGPNGAGKSSLINILAGISTKTSGKVIISGYDIDIYPKLSKKKIGVVPQEINLDTYFTIEEYLNLYAGYYGIQLSKDKINYLLKALHLKDKARSKARELSGGMKRRVMIAKALVHEPDLLILDEPTAGVDIELRDQLWSYVKKLNKQGVTIILTTHYMAEARELCDEIAFINNGKIIKSGSKENVLNLLESKSYKIDFKENLEDFYKKYNTKYNMKLLNKKSLEINLDKKDPISNFLNVIHNEKLEIADIISYGSDLEKVFKNLINNKIKS